MSESLRPLRPAPRPVLRRLFPTMTLMLGFLASGFATLLWHQHGKRLAETTDARIATVEREFDIDVENHADGLESVARVIASDVATKTALRDHASGPLEAWRAVLATMPEDNHISHLAFLDERHRCLVSIEAPKDQRLAGDRCSADGGVQNEKPAASFETDALGVLRHRITESVLDNGLVVGYVELGQELDEILGSRRDGRGLELALTVPKSKLQRRAWESARGARGQDADWDRLPENVISYTSHKLLPDELAHWAGAPSKVPLERESATELDFRSQHWRIARMPLRDSKGTSGATLLVMVDVTTEQRGQTRLMLLGGVLVSSLLGLLLGFTYALLRRTDLDILAQQLELKEREVRLNEAQRIAHLGSGTVDLRTGVVQWSDENYALFGVPPGTPVTFEVFRGCVHPDDRNRVAAAWKAAAARTAPYDLEHRICVGDEVRWVHARAEFTSDSEGRPLLAMGTSHDITERKRAQLALIDSEQRIRGLVESMNDLIFTLDSNLVFQSYHTPRSESRLLPPEHFLGKAFDEVGFPEPACRLIKDALSSTLQTGTPSRVEYPLEVGGVPMWFDVHVTSLPREDGTRSGVTCVARDITSRKRVEEVLRASREQFKLAVRGSNDGIWDLDLRTNSHYLSPRWKEQLGYRDHESSNSFSTFEDHLHPEDKPVVLENMARYLRDEISQWNFEFRLRHKDGTYRWILSRGAAVRDEAGKVVRMAGSHTDITERKLADEDLRATCARLEEETARANEMTLRAQAASTAKSDFLATMSHEIRTPMNGVIGLTGLLLDTSLHDQQRTYAEAIQASGETLLRLINSILDFSKIEAGKVELEAVDFDLHALLEDLASPLAYQAHQKGLELVCATDPQMPAVVRGDPGRLRQILTNLVGNAIKFTESGEIAVRATLQACAQGQATLRVSVCDTGIGIPADKIPTLFDKFTQADTSTTRRYGGTGLGLAIAKHLAVLMGGELGVESRLGQGSEFWLTIQLPCDTVEASPPSIVSPDLQGVKALIVDDSATSRDMLAVLLRSWGMRTILAGDGAAALQALYEATQQGDPIRVALIDLQMPGMSGATLQRAMECDKGLSGTRIVLLARVGAEHDEAEQSETAGCVTKPVRRRELREALSGAIVHGTSRGKGPSKALSARPRVSIRPARDSGQPFAGTNWRILLVEDNPTNQLVGLGVLAKLGLRADTADNGAAALAALRERAYDAVLMDVQMPVLDGLETTRLLRAMGAEALNSQVPVIAVTAQAMPDDREKCLAAGMNDFVTKPVTPRALSEVLKRWLPGAKTASTPPDQQESVPESGSYGGLRPVFDRGAVLNRLMGDDALVGMIVAAFLEDVPKQVLALRECLEGGDLKAAERYAHSIKGASASVGAEALREAARLVEDASRGGDRAGAKGGLPDMDREFDRFVQAAKVPG